MKLWWPVCSCSCSQEPVPDYLMPRMNHSQREGLVTPRSSLVKDSTEPNIEVSSPHPRHWNTRTGKHLYALKRGSAFVVW